MDKKIRVSLSELNLDYDTDHNRGSTGDYPGIERIFDEDIELVRATLTMYKTYNHLSAVCPYCNKHSFERDLGRDGYQTDTEGYDVAECYLCDSLYRIFWDSITKRPEVIKIDNYDIDSRESLSWEEKNNLLYSSPDKFDKSDPWLKLKGAWLDETLKLDKLHSICPHCDNYNDHSGSNRKDHDKEVIDCYWCDKCYRIIW